LKRTSANDLLLRWQSPESQGVETQQIHWSQTSQRYQTTILFKI